MPELFNDPETSDEIVIATIGNQKNPGQVVEILHRPGQGVFTTRGIAEHFRIKDIAVPQALMLAEIHEMTGVVSYILERIATATELNLPFRYEPEFKMGDSKYNLEESGDYMLLTRKD
ncbi:MAG: hypothetical protein JSU72_17055 [Deltaproteobacteria bacterium]|nr:MAG: hypothetical protein JSU72_17055 [Deltaproteobacteria bacterium]